MGILLWVLIVLGMAGALSLLALAVPLDIRFRLARSDRTESSLRLEWLFGLVGGSPSRRGAKPRAAEAESKPKTDPRHGPGLRALWHSGLVPSGLRLLPKLRRAVSVRELRVRAAVNAGDPAETGMAFALIGPASVAASMLPGTDIGVVPDFGDEAGVRGELRGSLRIVPIVALVPLVVFALSPATWRGVRRLREARQA